MAGDTDETRVDENGGVSRCGLRVVTEHDGKLVCEQFDSEGRARDRFQRIAVALGFQAPDV